MATPTNQGVNTGTTLKDSKFDIDGATATLAAYGEVGEELGDRTVLLDGEGMQLGRSPRLHGQHIQVPLRGVAVHINAFNFPAWGTFEKAACALLAVWAVLEHRLERVADAKARGVPYRHHRHAAFARQGRPCPECGAPDLEVEKDEAKVSIRCRGCGRTIQGRFRV